MRRPFSTCRVVLALAGMLPASGQLAGAQDTTGAVAADFVFSGTVVRAHAATIDLDDATSYAIVRVDRLLVGNAAFRALSGRVITVRLRRPEDAREGERRVYFTKGWYWGEDIGVIELQSVPAPSGKELERMQSDLDRQRREQDDRELAERLRTAELVVVGRVVQIRKADFPPLATEHDPDWHEAVIQVTRVLRGTPPGGQVTILFPATDDPMWRFAPKFNRKSEGIFLLRTSNFGEKPLPRLNAPHPVDFRPLSDEPRLRRLLAK